MRLSALSATVLLAAALPAGAQTAKTPDSQHDERRMQETLPPQEPAVPPPADVPQAQAPAADTLSLSGEELQQRPDLIVRALTAAVMQNHAENTAFLLPYYFRLPESSRDADLTEWASAVAAQGRGDYAEAVRRYRGLIAAHPDHAVIRFRLAQALFTDKQWEAAQGQFEKLQAENEAARAHVEPYLEAIRRQDRWELRGGISYLNDRNINNAPKNPDLGGGWRAPEAQSGQGISYQFGASKRKSLEQGLYLTWQADANGRHYWNNPRYNELTVRTAAGGGHENSRHGIQLTPFFEHTWYAGGRENDRSLKRFSGSLGLAAQWHYRLTPQWQLALSGETARNRYRSRTHLNGRSRQISATALYAANARQYWFGGADWGQVRARDGDDSYTRSGLRAGWGQEWPHGLSSRLTLSYAHRNYHAAGFFGQRQRNKETGLTASLWHRNLHFRGITPKLTWQYQKTRSNLPLYTYAKQRLFIEVGKQF